MRVKKENHFKLKPLIQQHVFRNNVGKCEVCHRTQSQIHEFKLKCVKR